MRDGERINKQGTTNSEAIDKWRAIGMHDLVKRMVLQYDDNDVVGPRYVLFGRRRYFERQQQQGRSRRPSDPAKMHCLTFSA